MTHSEERTFPYIESLVGMVGRLVVGTAVFRNYDMSKWGYVGLAKCRTRGMSECQHVTVWGFPLVCLSCIYSVCVFLLFLITDYFHLFLTALTFDLLSSLSLMYLVLCLLLLSYWFVLVCLSVFSSGVLLLVSGFCTSSVGFLCWLFPCLVELPPS